MPKAIGSLSGFELLTLHDTGLALFGFQRKKSNAVRVPSGAVFSLAQTSEPEFQ